MGHLLKKIVWFYHNLFNLRLGWLAIPIIGGGVALLNRQHGLSESLWAGTVAGLTGLLVTGTMTRVIQHFALFQNRLHSYLLGTGIPTGVTLVLHLSGQSWNQTPELFWSVIAPTLLTFITSICLNFGTYFFSQRNGPFKWYQRILKYIFTIPGRRLKRQDIH